MTETRLSSAVGDSTRFSSTVSEPRSIYSIGGGFISTEAIILRPCGGDSRTGRTRGAGPTASAISGRRRATRRRWEREHRAAEPGGGTGWGNRGGGGSHPHPAGYISHMTIGALWHLLLAGGLLTPWNRQKAAAVYRIMQISRQSSGPYRNDKPIESTWISLSTSAAAAPAVNFILSLSLCLSLCLSLLKMLFSILPSSLLFSSFLFFVVGFWFRNWKFQVSCWGWVGWKAVRLCPRAGWLPGQGGNEDGGFAVIKVAVMVGVWQRCMSCLSGAFDMEITWTWAMLPLFFSLLRFSPLPPPCLPLASSLPPYPPASSHLSPVSPPTSIRNCRVKLRSPICVQAPVGPMNCNRMKLCSDAKSLFLWVISMGFSSFFSGGGRDSFGILSARFQARTGWMVLWDSLRFLEIFGDSWRFYEILGDSMRFLEILGRYFEILWD